MFGVGILGECEGGSVCCGILHGERLRESVGCLCTGILVERKSRILVYVFGRAGSRFF